MSQTPANEPPASGPVPADAWEADSAADLPDGGAEIESELAPVPDGPDPVAWDPYGADAIDPEPDELDAFDPDAPDALEAPVPPTAAPVRPATLRLSGWAWFRVGAVALTLGLAGGVLGGLVVHRVTDEPGGGVLQVERRTAQPLSDDNDSIAKVAATVLPSTVQIVAAYDGKARGATGSGWVFDKQGHVITNNHVVAQAAEKNGPIDVIDHEGRHLRGEVVGRSAVYDLAVLKVDGAQNIPPAAIGSSDQMRVGETVVAFGSPLGLSATVTSGIVSALNRPVTTGNGDDSSFINAIQTDAAINPGNSGGPLTDLQGRVIGVNSAIASLGSSILGDEGGSIGVGFAIPIEQVQITTDQILRTGKAQYPLIGANVRGTEQMDGAVIDEVVAGSAAAKAGLRKGDQILQVEGRPVTGSIDVVVAIRSHRPGEEITLTIRRDGKERDVRVRLDAKTG